jgi:hypothetical protein
MSKRIADVSCHTQPGALQRSSIDHSGVRLLGTKYLQQLVILEGVVRNVENSGRHEARSPPSITQSAVVQDIKGYGADVSAPLSGVLGDVLRDSVSFRVSFIFIPGRVIVGMYLGFRPGAEYPGTYT